MTSIRDFVPIKRLGEGSFSSVYLVKRISDNRLYALKKVKLASLKSKQIQNSVNEVRLLASLSPEYIIAYKESFFDEGSSILCVVMEYADGGDLGQCINTAKASSANIPEPDIWKAAYDILMGLKTLHDKKILHRDLKSANVFIVGSRYKIGDLNVSKVAKNKMVHTQTGTPYYVSPQVWRDQPYDSKSDVWSLGCILYEMAANKPPFRGQDMHTLYRAVQKGIYDPIGPKYSKNLAQFISLCLKVAPKNRPSTNDLLRQSIMLQQKTKRVDQPHLCPDLLKTIKVQKSLKGLQKQLPRPNYAGQLYRQRPASASPAMSAALINKITKKQCQRKKQQLQLKAGEQVRIQDIYYKEKISRPFLKQEKPREEKKAGFVKRTQIAKPASPRQKPRIYSGKVYCSYNRVKLEDERNIRNKSSVRVLHPIKDKEQPHTPKLVPPPHRVIQSEQRKREPGKITKKQSYAPSHPVWWG